MVSKKDFMHAPIHHLDIAKVKSVADLADGLKHISFQGRNLGRVVSVLENALEDEDCVLFFGAAGALVPAGLRKVIRDLMEYKLIDVLVTTGAIAYHDYYEARGGKHYMVRPDEDDIVLREVRLDRIYDTVADEDAFWECDAAIGALADSLEPRPYSSREFMYELGKTVDDEESIVGTAARLGVPYFIPALNDSSIGIAITGHYYRRRKAGKEPMRIDSIRDNWEITQIKVKAKRTGVWYIAGGTPKNYISQVAPLAEILGFPWDPHMYAAQITTDVPQWGGLSGCTFEESQSWGKFHKDAKMAQALCEATIGLPVVATSLLQKGVAKNRPRRRYTWSGDTLKSLRIG